MPFLVCTKCNFWQSSNLDEIQVYTTCIWNIWFPWERTWKPNKATLYFLELKCYKNEHSFEICHWAWSSKLSCKISRRYDQPFLRKWRLKLPFLVVFRIFPNGNCHFRPGLWKADVTLRGCTSCRVTVLVLFCTRKTRGDTQFWIELALPYTLANNNEMNSDDRLPFIIFLTPISCDGSNRLWRQCLLPSPCSLWRHKQTLVGVIRPLAGRNCRRLAESLNDIVFIDISAFTAYFAFGFFVYCFVRLEWPYRTKIVSILIAL